MTSPLCFQLVISLFQHLIDTCHSYLFYRSLLSYTRFIVGFCGGLLWLTSPLFAAPTVSELEKTVLSLPLAESGLDLAGSTEVVSNVLENASSLVLRQHTAALLDSLAPLSVPEYDPNLLQYGISYSFTGGTGNLPGREASIATCGIHLAAPASGQSPTDVTSGEPPQESLKDALISTYENICCDYDASSGQYGCARPDLFPNKQGTTRGAGGTELITACVVLDELSAQSFFVEQGITYRDGGTVHAGNICCALDYAAAGRDLGAQFSGDRAMVVNHFYQPSTMANFGQDCAPGHVATGTGFSDDGNGKQFTTEIFGEGDFSMFEENRNYGYSLQAAGRLTLRNTIISGADSVHSVAAVFRRLGGEYRHYLNAHTLGGNPFMAFAGLDGNQTSFLTSNAKIIPSASNPLVLEAAPAAISLPVHFTVGGGLGKIYDIEPRIRLKKLEAMLIKEGVIQETLTHQVAKEIMVVWWALRGELGYDQRMLYTFKVLHDQKLLTGQLTPQVVYRFGQIFRDPQFVRRRVGSNSRLGVRLGRRFVKDKVDADPTVVFELRDERIFNLDFDSELTWDCVISIAPRAKDYGDNQLTGTSLPFVGITGGQFVVNLPISYRRYLYDSFVNKRGMWEFSAHVATGYAAKDTIGTIATTPKGLNVAVGGGAAYTLFRNATNGISFAVNADLGYVGETFLYAVTGGIQMVLGHGETLYSAAGDLGDPLPFDLPLP